MRFFFQYHIHIIVVHIGRRHSKQNNITEPEFPNKYNERTKTKKNCETQFDYSRIANNKVVWLVLCGAQLWL